LFSLTHGCLTKDPQTAPPSNFFSLHFLPFSNFQIFTINHFLHHLKFSHLFFSFPHLVLAPPFRSPPLHSHFFIDHHFRTSDSHRSLCPLSGGLRPGGVTGALPPVAAAQPAARPTRPPGGPPRGPRDQHRTPGTAAPSAVTRWRPRRAAPGIVGNGGPTNSGFGRSVSRSA